MGAQSLRDFPTKTAKESAKVAGRTDKIILETDFGPAAIPGVTQTVTANQFALGAFDGVTPAHGELELRGFHLATAGLQKGAMLPDRNNSFEFFLV